MLFSGFKNPYKKSAKHEEEFIHEYRFVERENEGRKPNKNSSLRILEFMPRNLD
jgi:hypothetical protein